jgi:hypothetical protein
METKLEIETTAKGYKNLNLKTRPKKGIKGLDNDQYIIVEKLFPTGYKVDTGFKDKEGNPNYNYSCKVKYNEQEVSFFLNEKEHEVYSQLGGIGDKVKITAKDEIYVMFNGTRGITTKLVFERA